MSLQAVTASFLRPIGTGTLSQAFVAAVTRIPYTQLLNPPSFPALLSLSLSLASAQHPSSSIPSPAQSPTDAITSPHLTLASFRKKITTRAARREPRAGTSCRRSRPWAHMCTTPPPARPPSPSGCVCRSRATTSSLFKGEGERMSILARRHARAGCCCWGGGVIGKCAYSSLGRWLRNTLFFLPLG